MDATSQIIALLAGFLGLLSCSVLSQCGQFAARKEPGSNACCRCDKIGCTNRGNTCHTIINSLWVPVVYGWLWQGQMIITGFIARLFFWVYFSLNKCGYLYTRRSVRSHRSCTGVRINRSHHTTKYLEISADATHNLVGYERKVRMKVWEKHLRLRLFRYRG